MEDKQPELELGGHRYFGAFEVLKGRFRLDDSDNLLSDKNAEISFWVRHSGSSKKCFIAVDAKSHIDALKAHKAKMIACGAGEKNLPNYAEAIAEIESLLAKRAKGEGWWSCGWNMKGSAH